MGMVKGCPWSSLVEGAEQQDRPNSPKQLPTWKNAYYALSCCVHKIPNFFIRCKHEKVPNLFHNWSFFRTLYDRKLRH